MGKRVCFRWPGGAYKAVTLSFDDNRFENFRLADIMRKNGIKGTFNINSGIFLDENSPKIGTATYRKCSKTEMLQFIGEYGDIAEMAVHAVTHPYLESLSAPQVIYELIEDKRAIEEMTGYPVRGMALPMGTYKKETLALIKECGLKYARTTKQQDHTKSIFSITAVPEDFGELQTTAHSNIPTLVEEGKAFAALEENYIKDARLYYLWGHSYEFEENNNWDTIEDFCAAVGNQPNTWYATNIEIVDYCEAYKSLEWAVNGKSVYNPSALSVWVRMCPSRLDEGKIVEILPGKVTRIE